MLPPNYYENKMLIPEENKHEQESSQLYFYSTAPTKTWKYMGEIIEQGDVTDEYGPALRWQIKTPLTSLSDPYMVVKLVWPISFLLIHPTLVVQGAGNVEGKWRGKNEAVFFVRLEGPLRPGVMSPELQADLKTL